MALARFRFHGELADFLRREHRHVAFAHRCARAATLKNAIEALGVPHTEAARVAVNGAPATLGRIVREGDAIEVHPWAAAAVAPPQDGFVADAHLGGLARFLRMLGYDTVHHPGIADDEIRRLAERERRLVLSRDRELLKCREIVEGCYVHARKPEEQLREIAARFALLEHARPFTLCLACNVALEPIDRQRVAARLPERVAERYARFTHCVRCDRVYWPGTHYARMQAVLTRVLPAPLNAAATTPR